MTSRVAEVAAIRDEDIDTTDVPEAGEGFFERARLLPPGPAKGEEIGAGALVPRATVYNDGRSFY